MQIEAKATGGGDSDTGKIVGGVVGGVAGLVLLAFLAVVLVVRARRRRAAERASSSPRPEHDGFLARDGVDGAGKGSGHGDNEL